MATASTITSAVSATSANPLKKTKTMSRYTPRKSTEFEERQFCFAFGEACRFVASLANDVKKALTGYVKAFFTKAAPVFKKPNQLVLELDAIAQMPLFKFAQPEA